jgi:hypothetical protein
MEARSQLRHRPTCEDTTALVRMTLFILADCGWIVNESSWRSTDSRGRLSPHSDFLMCGIHASLGILISSVSSTGVFCHN